MSAAGGKPQFASTIKKNLKDDIKIIANILENAGAVKCIPSHECPNSKHNVLTFNLPMGYYVEINFRKLAEAVYESGYRLCEGCEKVTE